MSLLKDKLCHMAIRNIVKMGDNILRQKSRIVKKIDNRIIELLDDMKETLIHENGIGLAAPQVGVLKRIFIVNSEEDGYMEFINPEIISSKGEKIDAEGCLSRPGVYGEVIRPAFIKLRALDRNGKICHYSAKDIIARAFSHELDHLDGVLFIDKVIRWVENEK